MTTIEQAIQDAFEDKPVAKTSNDLRNEMLDIHSKQLENINGVLQHVAPIVQQLVASNNEIQAQLDAQAKLIAHNSLIIGEVDNRARDRYKYLLQEQQSADSTLEASIKEVASNELYLREITSDLDRQNDALKTQMTSTKNAVGYCLRQVRVALENDPQSQYLKAIYDAIDSLNSKID